MLGFTIFSLLAALAIDPQSNPRLLEMPTRLVSGTVSDESGRPIESVQIDYAGTVQRTGVAGQFQFETKSPVLVFRKRGYRSFFLKTDQARDVRITLSAEQRMAPLCAASAKCETIQGWGARLCFPLPNGITASKQGQDADYGQRGYLLKLASGVVGISHGVGPLWGGPIPSVFDVRQLIEFDEHIYLFAGEEIIDARGMAGDGTYWRQLGRVGETASYRGVDRQTAKTLDEVLDGFCILPGLTR
jgi:hypothetical protein